MQSIKSANINSFFWAFLIYISGVGVGGGIDQLKVGHLFSILFVPFLFARLRYSKLTIFYFILLMLILVQNLVLETQKDGLLTHIIIMVLQISWVNFISNVKIDINRFTLYFFILNAVNICVNISIYGYEKMDYLLIPTYPANQSLVGLGLLIFAYKFNSKFYVFGYVLVSILNNAKTYAVAAVYSSKVNTKKRFFYGITGFGLILVIAYLSLNGEYLILLSSTRLYLWREMLLYVHETWTLENYLIGSGFRTFENVTQPIISNSLSRDDLYSYITIFGNMGQMYAHSTLLELIYSFGVAIMFPIILLVKSQKFTMFPYQLKIFLLISVLFNEILTSMIFTGILSLLLSRNNRPRLGP